MKCEECIKNGEKSMITNNGSRSTLMAYPTTYDEDGNIHHHDGNRVTTYYKCSNGHEFVTVRRGTPCPSYPENCDYGGYEENLKDIE